MIALRTRRIRRDVLAPLLEEGPRLLLFPLTGLPVSPSTERAALVTAWIVAPWAPLAGSGVRRDENQCELRSSIQEELVIPPLTGRASTPWRTAAHLTGTATVVGDDQCSNPRLPRVREAEVGGGVDRIGQLLRPRAL